jgi:hypothetical protein
VKRSRFWIRAERFWPSCSSRTSGWVLMGARVEGDWRLAGEGSSAPLLWGPPVQQRLYSHTAGPFNRRRPHGDTRRASASPESLLTGLVQVTADPIGNRSSWKTESEVRAPAVILEVSAWRGFLGPLFAHTCRCGRFSGHMYCVYTYNMASFISSHRSPPADARVAHGLTRHRGK